MYLASIYALCSQNNIAGIANPTFVSGNWGRVWFANRKRPKVAAGAINNIKRSA